MSITAYVIPAHGDVTAVAITDELRDIQHLVGGDFQVIDLPVGNLTGFLNETGKLTGKRMNARATFATRGSLMQGDYIAGTMVVLGAPDEQGRSTSADPEQVEQLLDPNYLPAA